MRRSHSRASTICWSDRRVRDRLERAARKFRMARLVCLRAGWLADEQRPNIVEASMSKALAAKVAQEATRSGWSCWAR